MRPLNDNGAGQLLHENHENGESRQLKRANTFWRCTFFPDAACRSHPGGGFAAPKPGHVWARNWTDNVLSVVPRTLVTLVPLPTGTPVGMPMPKAAEERLGLCLCPLPQWTFRAAMLAIESHLDSLEDRFGTGKLHDHPCRGHRLKKISVPIYGRRKREKANGSAQPSHSPRPHSNAKAPALSRDTHQLKLLSPELLLRRGRRDGESLFVTFACCAAPSH